MNAAATMSGGLVHQLAQSLTVAALVAPFTTAKVNRAMYAPRQQDQELLLNLPEKFEEFSKAMDHFGYSWEPYEVTTRDGHNLTLLRITGKLSEDEKLKRS